MNKLACSRGALGVLFALLAAAPSYATLPTRVWVSNSGIDSGTCGATTSPCRTLQQAQTNVATGGTISFLGPGDFGGGGVLFTITKSLHITNDYVGEAGFQTNVGINVDAGAGSIVTLRGLIIDGAGTGAGGITFQSGSALHIQNCVIRNFGIPQGAGGIGISIQPNTGNSQVFISDTLVYNNGTFGDSGGIRIRPISSGTTNVVLDRVHMENNVFALKVDAGAAGNTVRVTVRDSVVSGNAADGITATTAIGKPNALVLVERSTIVNNGGSGVRADAAHAVVFLSDSTISGNGAGVNATSGGQIISYGNNRNNNNIGADGVATSFDSAF